MIFKQIYLTLTDILDESEPGSNGNKGELQIPQITRTEIQLSGAPFWEHLTSLH